MSQNFASECTIHGVNFIFGQSNSKLVRFWWFSCLFLSFIGFIYYFYLAYHKWTFSPEILMRIRDQKSSEIAAPAITICPRIFARDNLINYTSTMLRFMEDELYENKKECEHLTATFNWCISPQFAEKICQKFLKDLDKLDTIKIIKNLAYEAEELFIGSSPEVVRIFTSNGICYTFNMLDRNAIFNNDEIHKDFDVFDNLKHRELKWSVESGYKNKNVNFPVRTSEISQLFTLYMTQNNLENACELQELEIVFHLPSEMPTKFHNSLQFAYQSRLNLEIITKSYRTHESLRSFSPKVRKCFFNSERNLKLFKSYTKAHCELECLINTTIDKCNCVLFWMPRNKNTQVCTLSNQHCAIKSENDFGDVEKLACNCLPACYDIKYSVETSPAGLSLLDKSLSPKV